MFLLQKTTAWEKEGAPSWRGQRRVNELVHCVSKPYPVTELSISQNPGQLICIWIATPDN